MIQDMTKGNPTRLILKFAFPLLIGNLFQQFYSISDIIIVGRLIGVNALAAVGSTASLYFVMLLVSFGFTGGLTVITSQCFGAKENENIRRSVTHSIVASTILSVIITAIMLIWLKSFLRLMNVPEEIMDDAYKFMFTISTGLILIVAYNLFSGFIRALGDSKTPLYFLIFSSVLNILLNLFLIHVMKMGVVGSALGTIIALSISVICCIFYIHHKFPILRLQKKDWILDWKFMRKHLDIAIPMALQFSVLSMGLIILQSVCNTFGADVIAAFTAALRIEQLATQPLVALGIAMSTYAAQNYGAGMITRIRRGVFNCSLISLGFSIILALSVRFIGEEMIMVFIENGDAKIINIAKEYLNISTLFYFFLGQIFIFRNSLQGMGQSSIPLAAGFTELGMRSLAAIILATHMGYTGIFYASPIAWLGAATVVFVGYYLTIRKLGRRYINNHLQWTGNKLSLGNLSVKEFVAAE